MLTNKLVAMNRLRHLRQEVEEHTDGLNEQGVLFFHDILNALEFDEGEQQTILGFQYFLVDKVDQPIDLPGFEQ